MPTVCQNCRLTATTVTEPRSYKVKHDLVP